MECTRQSVATIWKLVWIAVFVLSVSKDLLAATVYLDPSSATIPAIGGATVLDVVIDDPSTVYAYTFGLRYDGSLLNVTNVTSTIGGNCNYAANYADDGNVCISVFCTSPVPGTNSALVSITFQGELPGTSLVAFEPTMCGSASVPACSLQSSNGDVPCVTQGATIYVQPQSPSPAATATATETVTLTPQPPTTATATLSPTAAATSTLSPTAEATSTTTLSPTAVATSTAVLSTPAATATRPGATPQPTRRPTRRN